MHARKITITDTCARITHRPDCSRLFKLVTDRVSPWEEDEEESPSSLGMEPRVDLTTSFDGAEAFMNSLGLDRIGAVRVTHIWKLGGARIDSGRC